MQKTLNSPGEQKIRREHQDRLAVVYVRQSTVQQVQHHQESTQLQYGLVDHAQKLGWPQDRILVIDEDLGVSGASVEGRHGFQRLLSEVALNHVGLILGIEMSRLARSCKDWYQLLELCALFRTLISDLDGLYDPTSYNDRLLLGLKGTMSEAELHILKQRMLQGALHKARRGELVSKVPIGYVRDTHGNVQQDPDEQAQAVVRLIFEQFGRIGSVAGVLRWLAGHQVKLPVRVDSGPSKGQLDWRRPSLTTVRNVLAHPMYAGAYVYGRTCQNPTSRRVRGVPQRLPRDEWQVLLKDRYPAYISWQAYERNVCQIDENRSLKSRRGAVRQGRALLAGLLVCGRCGHRMMTRYQGKSSQPRYLCDTDRAIYGGHRCQGVAASPIDEEVARLALLALTPGAVDVSLQVAEDIDNQREKIDSQWRSRLERAVYEAERAGRQFDATEPENRLVARTLEKAWEVKLRVVRQVEQDHERFQQEQPARLTATQRSQIQMLTADLPTLWNASTTTDEDRKVILRQMIDRVVVNVEGNTEWVELRIHWVGGHETYSRVRRPVGGTAQLSHWPNLLNRLKELKGQGLSARQIAGQLHDEGFKPAKGGSLTAEIVRTWLSRHGIAQKRTALSIQLSSNEWTIPDLIDRYRLSNSTIYGWIRRGEVKARQLGDAGSRWIIQAAQAELDHLANTPRTRHSSTDENISPAASPDTASVTRRAV